MFNVGWQASCNKNLLFHFIEPFPYCTKVARTNFSFLQSQQVSFQGDIFRLYLLWICIWTFIDFCVHRQGFSLITCISAIEKVTGLHEVSLSSHVLCSQCQQSGLLPTPLILLYISIHTQPCNRHFHRCTAVLKLGERNGNTFNPSVKLFSFLSYYNLFQVSALQRYKAKLTLVL